MEGGSRRSSPLHTALSNHIFPCPHCIQRPWAAVGKNKKERKKDMRVGRTKIEWVPHGLIVACNPVVPCLVTFGSCPQAWRSDLSKKMSKKKKVEGKNIHFMPSQCSTTSLLLHEPLGSKNVGKC